MAGKAQNIPNRNEPDGRFQSFNSNDAQSESQVPANSLSHFTMNQYIRGNRGIFSGAFGALESNLSIATGILDITQDSTGDIRVRRTLHVNPESGTTDTLDAIECDGGELPYQELHIIGVAGDTLTVTHDFGSATGTQKPILCPGDADATITGDELVKLIYDDSVSKWILMSGGGGGAGSFPLDYTVDDKGSTSGTVTHDLSAASGHKLQFTATGDCDITLSNIPSGTAMDFYIEVTQDSTGGRTITVNDSEWVNFPSITETKDTTSLIACHADGDGNIRAITLLNASPSSGFSGNLSDLTIDTDLDLTQTYKLILDNDDDTYIQAVGDDDVHFITGGTQRMGIDNDGVDINDTMTFISTGHALDLNSNELILDADGDTKMVLTTDDSIRIQIAGVADALIIDNKGDLSWNTSGITHVLEPDTTDMTLRLGASGDSFILGHGTGVTRLWTFTQNHLITTSTDNGWIFESTYSPATPAANDVPALYQWNHKNSIGTVEPYAEMKVVATSITNGSEDADIIFSAIQSGTLTEMLKLDGSTGRINVSNGDISMNNNGIIAIQALTYQSPPSITGSRGGNAALASLLSAHDGDLWTDNTTA